MGGKLTGVSKTITTTVRTMTYRAELHSLAGLGLIVECSSGIVWTNQVGGAWNLHPEVEGLFVPIRTWTLGPTRQQGSGRPPEAAAIAARDPRVRHPSSRAPDGSAFQR